jgi:hypothetical protein
MWPLVHKASRCEANAVLLAKVACPALVVLEMLVCAAVVRSAVMRIEFEIQVSKLRHVRNSACDTDSESVEECWFWPNTKVQHRPGTWHRGFVLGCWSIPPIVVKMLNIHGVVRSAPHPVGAFSRLEVSPDVEDAKIGPKRGGRGISGIGRPEQGR